ncbi:MAG: hypothetical protein Q9228_006844, partial [Teloschistes exilis]
MALLVRMRSSFAAKPSVNVLLRAHIPHSKLVCHAESIWMGGTRQITFRSFLVTPEELSKALAKNVPTKISTAPRVVPLCAAWFLPNDPKSRTGHQVFKEKRIPSARFFDLDAVKDHNSPYPHQLPSPEEFAKAMQEIGIRIEDDVVVYDTQELGIFSAPRVAWTLKVFGHPTVHLLNNFRLWVEQGHPTESGQIEAIVEEPSQYPIPNLDASKVVNFSQMKEIAKDHGKEGAEGIQILDARSKGRWAGTEPEPRPGLPSGHIPGSINVPVPELLDPQTGALLPGEKLRRLFESKGLDSEKPIVSSCGTGVTAAVIDAALGEAGFGQPEARRLYDGSWTEWAQRATEADDEELALKCSPVMSRLFPNLLLYEFSLSFIMPALHPISSRDFRARINSSLWPQIAPRSSASSQKSQRSARHVFNPLDDPRPETFKFPNNYHLIVTTAHSVYTCGSHGITEIFKSGSNGIVAAKRASNGSGVLAVADDQLVILHDVRRGMRRSYRLRSADVRHPPSLCLQGSHTAVQGQMRMLRYAKDPDRLFFTTTLQNAVQVYDLDQAALLDSVNDHPSPPTAFALSSTSHLLLSASVAPPVIKLTNLLLKTRPLLLRPQCSSADVVVVEFHPERGNVFILCFADGTGAVYDAAYVFRDNGRGQRRSGASGSDSRWELAHIKFADVSGRTASERVNDNISDSGGNMSSSQARDKQTDLGIAAAGFVPGHKTTVVTVGSNGTCYVVDFAPSESREASIIHTWQAPSSATCLSILSPSTENGTDLPISAIKEYDRGIRDSIVAVGSSDGHVSLFNIGGTLLVQQPPASNSLAVIDIAWMAGDDWPAPIQSQPAQSVVRRQKSSSSGKSLGSGLAGHRPALEEIVNISPETKAPGNALTNVETSTGSSFPAKGSRLRRTESDPADKRISAFNHMDLSPMRELHPNGLAKADTPGRTDTSTSSSLGSMMKHFQFPIPPTGNVSRHKALQENVRHLPRNNSWATDLQPHDSVPTEGLKRMASHDAQIRALNVPGKTTLGNTSRDRRPLANVTSLASPEIVTEKKNQRLDQHGYVPNAKPTTVDQEVIAYDEDPWTDIAIDDDQADGEHATNGTRAAPRENFTIHNDNFDRTNHPRPLSAHPSTIDSPDFTILPPLPPPKAGNAPGIRAAPVIHHRRNRNGTNNNNSESHRSSIYGPGALAKKVQQAVMITVNVELDVLRREMDR